MQRDGVKTVILTCALFLLATTLFSQVRVDEVLCENRVNPMGIDSFRPKLSWILNSHKRGKSQTAYQIQVSNEEDGFKGHLVWDSGKVYSNLSVKVPYDGPELSSLHRYYWRVKVWDEKGLPSKWSSTGFWQMGMLKSDDWKSNWITHEYAEGFERNSPIFRNEIFLDKDVESATAVISAHGLYEAYINGDKVGDAFLTPGWTSYNKRLQYQVYDVTEMLRKGGNVIGAILGSGWYRTTLAWEGNNNIYGDKLSLLFQLNVTYVDGSTKVFGTNNNWKCHGSSIICSEIYNGEIIDGRKRINGWQEYGFNDENWYSAQVEPLGFSNLIATYNEPVRQQETFLPQKLIITPKGEKVLDFGQNLVGWINVEVQGKQGDSLIIDHAEVLDKAGNFYTENLRNAAQRNIYVLSGAGTEHFRPHFTWQGFRYIRLNGDIDVSDLNNFKAVALYSDMPKIGEFHTSNQLLNQLQHNIKWGQYGNFLDVPTDCPQRDERLGWTGDAQVFFPTAAYNMQVDNFFVKWMKDLESDQLEDGRVPHVIPNVLGDTWTGSAGWADASTIIPWKTYLLYGNMHILEEQYESMKAWVDYMKGKSVDYLWNNGTAHFGDWLFYRPEDDNDGRAALTDKHLIAQCFFANSTQILINTAKILGKVEDENQYTELLRQIKHAFRKEYLTPNGRLVSSSQTAYVLALQFEMLPEELRIQAANRLVENIKDYDYHLTTGFLGTPYINHVLSQYGYHDLAYTLLMQQTYPSWLYPVTVGATTVWERWDGIKPDGNFQTPGMNSFNHYAYGAIGDWMYSYLGGIKTSEKRDEVGYRKIYLKPFFYNKYVDSKVSEQNKGEMLNEVKACLKTYYGEIVSHWKMQHGYLEYRVSIPVNTTSEIFLPFSQTTILEKNKPLSQSKFIKIIDKGNDFTKILIGSGKYAFRLKL